MQTLNRILRAACVIKIKQVSSCDVPFWPFGFRHGAPPAPDAVDAQGAPCSDNHIIYCINISKLYHNADRQHGHSDAVET